MRSLSVVPVPGEVSGVLGDRPSSHVWHALRPSAGHLGKEAKFSFPSWSCDSKSLKDSGGKQLKRLPKATSSLLRPRSLNSVLHWNFLISSRKGSMRRAAQAHVQWSI